MLPSELHTTGYLVARSVLDCDAIDELCAAFPTATPGSTLHVDVGDDTPHLDRWRSLEDHSAIVDLVRALGRRETRVHGRDPGRGAGAQGLHADRPPGRRYDIDGITVIWMLDEFTEVNGATRVVPGSHRGAAAVPRALAQPGVRHPDEVVIVGQPGDALIFDSHLWHSGRVNITTQRRRAVQMTVTRLDPT